MSDAFCPYSSCPKSPAMSFGVFEMPISGTVCAKDARGLWARHHGEFVPLVPVQSLQLWAPPVTPGTEMNSTLIYLDGIRVHQRCVCLCGSDVPGHGSTQSKGPDCPFSVPATGRAPLILLMLLSSCKYVPDVPSENQSYIIILTPSRVLSMTDWSSLDSR